MRQTFGLRTKLFGSSILVLILVMTFTVMGLFILSNTNQRTKDLYEVYNQGLQELQTMSLSLYKFNRRASEMAQSYMDTRSTINSQSVKYDLADSSQQVGRSFDNFIKVVDAAHRSPGAQDLIDQFTSWVPDWSEKAKAVAEIYDQKDKFLDIVLNPSMTGVFDNMTGGLDSLSVEIQTSSQAAYDEISAQNSLAFLLFLIFAALVLVIVLGVVYYQNRVILRPILQVHSMLRNIATGDADLTRTLPVATKDEIGQICADFNTFLSLLRSIVSNVQDNVGKTGEVAQSLHIDAIEISASLTEINANNQNISQNIDVLDSRLGEASASTRSLLQALQGLRVRVSEEQSLVDSSTGTIRGMIEGIHGVTTISRTKRQASAELVEVSKESGRQLEEASQAVSRINNAVDTILEMTQVVSAIAAQTNLLSMNAAIEAAHAGEAGAGFSVVADEIRKLASTSTDQSRDIGKELKSIVGEIQKAWDLTHQAQSQYATLLEEVEGVNKALVDIMERNERLQDQGTQVLDSLEGLGRASAAVGQDMETIDRSTSTVESTMDEVRRVSAEVSTGMGEIAAGTRDITMATQKGSQANQMLVDQVRAVQDQLSKFVV